MTIWAVLTFAFVYNLVGFFLAASVGWWAQLIWLGVGLILFSWWVEQTW